MAANMTKAAPLQHNFSILSLFTVDVYQLPGAFGEDRNRDQGARRSGGNQNFDNATIHESFPKMYPVTFGMLVHRPSWKYRQDPPKIDIFCHAGNFTPGLWFDCWSLYVA
jgi:hypothetical protein